MSTILKAISATVELETVASAEQAFAHIVPIDLTSIFTGYGPLPAVTGTFNQTGAWDAVGQTRTVGLSDGSSATELMTGYAPSSYFSYTVSGFTGSLRFLANSAHGEWWFNRNPLSGKTRITWRYQFNPRSKLAIPALWLITKMLWRAYMNKALILSNEQILTLSKNRGL